MPRRRRIRSTASSMYSEQVGWKRHAEPAEAGRSTACTNAARIITSSRASFGIESEHSPRFLLEILKIGADYRPAGVEEIIHHGGR